MKWIENCLKWQAQRVERPGTVQPEHKKAQKELISVFKYLIGGVKKMSKDEQR